VRETFDPRVLYYAHRVTCVPPDSKELENTVFVSDFYVPVIGLAVCPLFEQRYMPQSGSADTQAANRLRMNDYTMDESNWKYNIIRYVCCKNTPTHENLV